NRGRVEDEVIIALAGPLAQRRHSPRSNWRFGGSGARAGQLLVRGTDFDQAADLIFRTYGNGDVAAAYWKFVEARTKGLVAGWWPWIEAVARALLKSETLSGDQIILEAVRAVRQAR